MRRWRQDEMIVMIDNYDSFTYNLVQVLEESGESVNVYRNDEISVARLTELEPEAVILSPGPCTPDVAGIGLQLVRKLAGSLPLFGVCLGHQTIAQAFGGRIVPSPKLMHGKTSYIHHDGKGLFKGIPSPFRATRYHSLIVEKATLPACFTVSAWTEEGEIMGIRHRQHTAEGVQFHPESIMTAEGKAILTNFLTQVRHKS